MSLKLSDVIPPRSKEGCLDLHRASEAVGSCVICGAPLPIKPLVLLVKSQLNACEVCGSWTYLPRRGASEQAAIHDTEEYFDHPYFEMRRRISPALIRRCRGIFARLEQAIDVAALRGQKLLDVGCDTGGFLQAARQEFGVVPVGVDTASRSVAAVLGQGIEAHLGCIEHAPSHLMDLQVITAIDLIEHVSDPTGFLQEIRKRLRPGGVAYLETPNIQSTVYQIGRALSHLTLGRPAGLFERLFPPQHLQYFTESSLAGLARTASFEVVRIHSRVLPWGDIAASVPTRLAMAAMQLMDRSLGSRILIWAVLRRPISGDECG